MAPIGTVGGLSLWWDNSVNVNVVDTSMHFIDAKCIFVDSALLHSGSPVCTERPTEPRRLNYGEEWCSTSPRTIIHGFAGVISMNFCGIMKNLGELK